MKIKESQLKNMIAKAINEAMDERAYDYAGSGIAPAKFIQKT